MDCCMLSACLLTWPETLHLIISPLGTVQVGSPVGTPSSGATITGIYAVNIAPDGFVYVGGVISII